MDALIKEDHFITPMPEEYETNCWGCGVRLLLPSFTPIYKCGWCGAVTNPPPRQQGSAWLRWRRLRDRCFVFILILFMLLVICGGVWTIYPVIFSISFSSAVLHSIITVILSISTLSSFGLVAFCSAGVPPDISWGNSSIVERRGLENFSYCHFCAKPKSPRTHHCSTCGMCVLDMDHHCPFIGNCVGAGNHRAFIIFLISAVISTIYLSLMSAYAGRYRWPPVTYGSLGHLTSFGPGTDWAALKVFFFSFINSAELLSPRGVILVYLFIAGFSVAIGLCMLLWQQLSYIYLGKTYLSNLRPQEEDGGRERDCRNIYRFFVRPYATTRLFSGSSGTKKSHRK